VIKYNGNVVEAFYYSTSCGYGSDISVWDEETQEYGYLVSRSISSEDTQLDLTDNTVFYNFISRRSLNDYDVSTPYYRWKAYLSMDEINSYYGEKAKVGTILSMSVDRRLAGGIAVELTVHGENGDYKVCGEYAIRQFLGNYAIYWRNDLESLFQMNYLPSAYIALRERSYNGQILGYDIIGGGYGHGVGMSQNAAHKMAQRGMDYKKIIHFFYQNVSIDTLY
jgi:stage II sporulation protein D